MIRLNRQTDYGIVLMTHMAAAAHAAPQPAPTLAAETHLPLPMVSKILKLLVRAGLLVSQRGAKGGYALARPPTSISVAELISTLEGPIAMTDCAEEAPRNCEHESICKARGHWQRINETVRIALQDLTLADMTAPCDSDGLVTIRTHEVALATANTVETR